VKGQGNQQDYGMRIYDPRLGRFLSTDPITDEYPELTPYQFASNTPIQAIDLDGLEGFIATGMPMGNSGHGHGMIVSPKMANSMPNPVKRMVTDFTPYVGTGLGLYEAYTGTEVHTGRNLAGWERGLNIIPIVGPLRKTFKAINAVDDLKDVVKTGNNLSDATKTINNLTSAPQVVNTTVSKFANHSNKVVAGLAKYGDDIAQAAYDGGKGGKNKLRDAIIDAGQGLNSKWQAHHMLPTELLGQSNILRQAVRQGFDFNGVVNGLALDGSRHLGSHEEYTKMALGLLEKNFEKYRAKRNFKEIAEMTANQLKDKVQNSSGKINTIQ